MKVDLLMADIHVATDDDPLSLGLQLFAVSLKSDLISLSLILQPFQLTVSCTRHINND